MRSSASTNTKKNSADALAKATRDKKFGSSLTNQQQQRETMKFSTTLALMGLATTASAVELTLDNWDSEVAGKTVFIKFQAPW
jgi:hypothetical protein